MTPKEKASELVNKMLVDFIDWTYCIPIDKQNNHTILSEAKQRALIAVDEIQEMLILTRKRLDISDTKQLKINDNNIIYSILWFDEVKQEIDKL